MVGRTPEYIGKKIEQKEVKMAMLAVIATAASILVFTSISSVIAVRKEQLLESVRRGDHQPKQRRTARFRRNSLRLSPAEPGTTAAPSAESTRIRLGTTSRIGFAMLIGRFLFLLPLLAAAGNLAPRKRVATTSGTFPTHGALFVGLLVGTVVIVGALTFFPALSLGPIVEHYLMHQGKLF